MDNELQIKLRKAGYGGDFGLSELIDACGNGLKYLEKYTDGWCVWAPLEISLSRYDGLTPEEAVANLYIALHKKSEPIGNLGHCDFCKVVTLPHKCPHEKTS